MRDLKHLFLLFGYTLIAAVPTYGVMTTAGHPALHAYLATAGLAAAFTLPYAALLFAKRAAETVMREMSEKLDGRPA